MSETPTFGMAPLADIFRRLIRNTGPISLSQFMGESNQSYYSGKDPLGLQGDFITAPEISQMFGELIGLWLADSWIQAGRPGPIYYVELGPGRGTLAKDALRSMKRYGLEPEVHFVEGAQALKDIQLAEIPHAVIHDDLSTVPMDGPLLVVGNEFLDALPVRQLVRGPDGWRERMIGLNSGPDDDSFAFVTGSQNMEAAIPAEWRDAEEGTILETCPAAAAIQYELAGRLVDQGGAALLVDYGHAELTPGSTFQAVHRHKKLDPLSAPGEADLTALVDFATLARIAESRDAVHLGTVTQGNWLRALGIEARAANLAAAAPHYAEDLELAKQRLIADDQMGQLFKVMGLAAPGWPSRVGFDQH